MKLFITGERSRRMMPVMMPVVAGMLVQVMQANWIAQATDQPDARIEIVTGDNTGVEQLVRDLLAGLGAPCHVVPTGVDPDTQEPAWDTRHEVVNALADHVLFVHTSPLDSSLGKSLLKVCGDKVEFALETV
jgi:hypothetical protein